MVANPGLVALVCVSAGSFLFAAYDIDTGQHVADWATYAADTTLVIYTYDEVTGGVP